MDAERFLTMLGDKNLQNLKKMQYKYSPDEVAEMLALMDRGGLRTELPLKDLHGRPLLLQKAVGNADGEMAMLYRLAAAESSLHRQAAMEDEICSTLRIENIETSRATVHRVMKGIVPVTEEEQRVSGLKLGLEFIADPANDITEENLHRLYMLAVNGSLEAADRLPDGQYYRNDRVFVVGTRVEHEGMDHRKLPEAMRDLMAYIREDRSADDLTKAAVIHFYTAWLHPYFDGNGRTARLIHLWYLNRCGCTAVRTGSLSARIQAAKADYYKAFRLVEDNEKISGRIDVTPFVRYFTDKVYRDLAEEKPAEDAYSRALRQGRITAKEAALWEYVQTTYGSEPFSTKQLEKDYGNAAYATIRAFVIKFHDLGLLTRDNYSNRPRYSAR